MLVFNSWFRIRRFWATKFGWAEMGLAVSLSWWGVQNLISPYSLNRHHAFTVLLGIAPERVWESIAAIGGLFYMLTIIRDDRWLKALGAGICSFPLFWICYNFIIDSNWGSGLGFYVVPFFFCCLAVKKNVRGTA